MDTSAVLQLQNRLGFVQANELALLWVCTGSCVSGFDSYRVASFEAERICLVDADLGRRVGSGQELLDGVVSFQLLDVGVVFNVFRVGGNPTGLVSLLCSQAWPSY